MIAVLGGPAEVERDLIRTRTGEGRARAKLRGQHMGRPSKMTAALKQKAGAEGKIANPSPILRAPMAEAPLRSTEQRPKARWLDGNRTARSSSGV
ncbi:MAG: hypothetical protein WA156_10300 [Methylocystis silviterrae]